MANDSVWHKEMERRKNDVLRVYNPTDQDYLVVYDRANGAKRFRVPAKGEASLVRYIAGRYIKQMFEKIVTEKQDAAVLKENERRAERGADAMNRHKEQLAFESNALNQIIKEDAQKLVATLYVGLESEFGIDDFVEEAEQLPEADNRPVFDRIFESVQKQKESAPAKVVDDSPSEPQKPTTKSYKCDFPGCDFDTTASIALINHKKTHRDETEEVKKKLVSEISQ